MFAEGKTGVEGKGRNIFLAEEKKNSKGKGGKGRTEIKGQKPKRKIK